MAGSRTAIVVDDMKAMRDMIERFLERNGFIVIKCASAGDFYKVLHDTTPDVVLLDVEMPDENGYQICDWIRNAQGNTNTPVLFVTSNNKKKDMEAARAVGGDYYVKKPFDEASILNGVERAIEIRKGKVGRVSDLVIGTRKTAIVVDDMKTMRDMAESILGTAGYSVMKCGSDVELFRLLVNVSPSVILLDVNMPGDNGYEICGKIRTEMPHIDCPIVFVTGNKSKQDIQEAKAAGGDYFITKPFDEASLIYGIRRGFQTRRSARRN
jgi:twitching motility two-component system response regulator PilH